ncbi:MAG: hypothetical protein C4518_18160 [Desulfobacteraceae bacterium]|nr:MAG: hypothetical protein C4518_18160 [Desulfobacteraceae bacterium]
MHHDILEPFHLSSDELPSDFLISPEQKEMERRWPVALRELTALIDRIKDIRRANPENLHQNLSAVEKKRLTRDLMEAMLKDEPEGLKRSVARRMADKIGNYLLWGRTSSVPVIHELIVLFPWWMSQMPGEVIPKIRDIGLNYVLNGRVVPLQMAWQDILEADPVYIGHCACRSAGVVDDLSHNDRVFNLLSEEDSRLVLDRFVDRYEALVAAHGSLPDTDTRYESLCRDLAELRRTGSPDYRLETLLQRTYPDWEILPVHEKYTPVWIRSMHKNHKAHLMHKTLAFELATIFYLSRGTIFSSMKLFDSPYTICSCPTPEIGGGCTLTNWYYFGGSNTSLMPNDAFYGRRKDEKGNILPCRHFPVRARRECLGCGCNHEAPSRDVAAIIAQADEMFQNHFMEEGGKET